MIPAIAAVRADVASASTVKFTVGSHADRAAAFSFDPVARIQAPSGVSDIDDLSKHHDDERER